MITGIIITIIGLFIAICFAWVRICDLIEIIALQNRLNEKNARKLEDLNNRITKLEQEINRDIDQIRSIQGNQYLKSLVEKVRDSAGIGSENPS